MMFGNKKGSQTVIESSSSFKADTTIIGTSSNFNGTLNSAGVIRIDGVFGGELNIDGNVIVGENGKINGNVRASKVTIAGTVEGNVYCSGTLELTSSGKLYGDIEVKTINIEDGAIFEGKCTMVHSSQKSSADNNESNTLVFDNSTTISE
jgi:cytoskeletal protein CcmA (bactofilin family)